MAIARAMVEAGTALAVMGNHEFNAVAWATPDPDNPDDRLRPHNNKNHNQHGEFLRQVGEDSDQHRAIIDWFRTLPLYLDLPGLRVIHACWHTEQLAILARYIDEQQRIRPGAWATLARKGSEPYEALETVLKGLEIPLPGGVEFLDKDDNLRRHIRTRWWLQGKLSYRDLAIVPPEVIERIPHTPAPEDVLPGYAGDKPLFVGHYWFTGTPKPLSPHIACLDYSIASESDTHTVPGKLCAYRWQSESELKQDHFVWVEGQADAREALK